MPKRTSVQGLAEKLEVSRHAAVATAEHPLEALAGDAHRVMNIPLDAITPNPDQPRKHFDQTGLEELAESIKSKGLLQPILVKQTGEGEYLLVAGERRWRAAHIAGIAKIPCMVTTGDELELAVIENLQREDLRPLEEADGLQSLAKRFNYTHDELATVIGKSRVTVSETLALLNLPKTIREECRTSDIASKSQLLQVVREKDQGKQLALWEGIKTGTYSTKTAKKARKENTGGRPKHHSKTFAIEEPQATVTVRFKKSRASAQEVWQALDRAAKEQKKLIRR